jgi:repressor of nif and glnA expression
VVEVADGRPRRFVTAIAYESSSIAPLEILMKGRMRDVLGAGRSGTGMVLGSLREIPAGSLDDARRLHQKMKKKGFPADIVFGRPGEHLLDIPVGPDRAGMVLLGGLNSLAVLEEAGYPRNAGPWRRSPSTPCSPRSSRPAIPAGRWT